MDYQARSKEFVLHALRPEKSVIFERAEGSRLWDIDGKMYLNTMALPARPWSDTLTPLSRKPSRGKGQAPHRELAT